MNLKLILEETAKQYGGKTAIICGDRRLSYAELDEASNKVANALLEMEVRNQRLPNSSRSNNKLSLGKLALSYLAL